MDDVKTREADRRLLVCDLDGTLLDPVGTVRPAVREALAEVRKAGIQVVLATGRSPWGIVEICRELDLPGPHITMNGAVCALPLQDRVIWARRLNREQLEAHLRFAAWLCVRPTLCLIDGYAVQKPGRGDLRIPHFASGTRLRIVDRLEDLADSGPIRTFLPTDPADVAFHAAVVRAARSQLRSEASIVWSDLEGIELMAPGTNKGIALVTLAAAMGVPMRNTAVVGDGPNDLEMIRLAGVSAAMANAPLDVRSVATFVVPVSADDGAAEAFACVFPDLGLRVGAPVPTASTASSSVAESAA